MYLSFFGLSLINLPLDKKQIVIRKLISSDIFIDRIIEMFNNFNLKFEDSLDLLYSEKTIQGKVIFIRNILGKKDLEIEKNSHRLLKLFEQSSEEYINFEMLLNEEKNHMVYVLNELYAIK
ncbi:MULTISPECIES: hypothetical protein [Bacteria]|uniref:hypothetical protein n=1 Tax=Bacteria TaxID=2 RepID=UPI0012B1745B|nr:MULTISPECIES: hypothetical protein [Bacteria]MRY42864.1 hypothetical protein [Parabacteroides distasonis]MZK52113.1 hypothetical protein [Clostridium beijerinckii]MZK61266.1 hypothetical protein [Clostridium beijerinckii]MZK71509.1 hypothetical protein [Clostridium beijerinckii]MZK76868.1 hypothetical protein [Clostridium beijerinckii]